MVEARSFTPGAAVYWRPRKRGGDGRQSSQGAVAGEVIGGRCILRRLIGCILYWHQASKLPRHSPSNWSPCIVWDLIHHRLVLPLWMVGLLACTSNMLRLSRKCGFSLIAESTSKQLAKFSILTQKPSSLMVRGTIMMRLG